MNNLVFSIYVLSILTSGYVLIKSVKNHFLPIALPVAGFSFVLILAFLVQIVNSYSISLPVRQLLSDVTIFLPLIGEPLLLWIFTEYYLGKKLSNKKFLLVWVVPLLVLCVFLMSIVEQPFYTDLENNHLITGTDRLTPFAEANRLYRQALGLLILLWAGFVIRTKTRNSYFELLLITGVIAIPMLLMFLKVSGYISVQLGAPFWSLLLLWGVRQYRLLDMMPVALQQVVDKLKAGLVILNPQDQVVYSNDRAMQLLSINADVKQLNKAPAPHIISAHFDLALKKPQQANILIDPKPGIPHKTVIEGLLEPLLNARQQYFGCTILLYDITERSEHELALEKFAEELQKLDVQKSEFFAGVSHEFRTPLTLSLGALKDISGGLHGEVPSSLHYPLQQTRENNERLLRLVNQLLELSQLQAGAMPLSVQAVKLNEHLPMLVSVFESLAKQQNITINLNTEEESSEVYFDYEALEKIISNLLSNALKSVEQGGVITIAVTEVDQNWLQLIVEDDGCGISKELLPHIFEPFFCRDNHNSVWSPGTGIGLSLVQQLLGQHGGTIVVDSTVDQGSTFTLRLRKGNAHFSEQQLIDESVLSSRTDSKKNVPLFRSNQTNPVNALSHDSLEPAAETLILIVEDNADMRRYIRFHLGSEFRLIEAIDGEEGLQLAQQVLPDLILCDVMMPRMDGVELCYQIKQDVLTSHIPVLLLTAKSTQLSKIEGLRHRADDYLTKPFDVEELIVRIKNLVQLRADLKWAYRQHSQSSVVLDSPLPKLETRFLDNLKQHMFDQMADPKMYTADLASAVNMSERSLNRKLKALTGETPKQMLRSVRLQHSSKLLRETDMSVSEISYVCGFGDTSYFARIFKAHFSKTPLEYKKA